VVRLCCGVLDVVDRIEKCPVCETQVSRGWPALVAPFIADFVLHVPVQRCRLLECDRCRLRFFAERFTSDELASLYTGYRGDKYFRSRHRHEPWYTEEYNRWIGNDIDRTRGRREALKAFLHESGASGPLREILDYGGDGGQLIPQEMAERAYVFDISGVSPVAGVHGIANEESLQPGGYDLTLISHVLEHAPEPIELLEKTRRLAREGGLLYVEVPMERPWMGFVGRGFMMAAYLDLFRRSPILLRCVDFYSSGFRVKAGFVPPFGFSKLHEHINFFSAESLKLAVERSGYEVLRVALTSTLGPTEATDSIACLARAKKSD